MPQDIQDDISTLKSSTKKTYSYDDTGNGQRMFDQFGDKYRYIENGKYSVFYHYNGKKWEQDATNQVGKDLNTVINNLYNEPLHSVKDMNKDEAEKYRARFIRRSRQSSGKKGALSEFKILITFPADIFDHNKNLVNTPAGIWHTDSDTVTENDPNAMLSKITGGSFDSGDDCPKWKKFINETFKGDVDVINFVKRAVGYSMLGDNGERKMFVLHGEAEEHNGNNGKSVFVEVIAHVLKDYATVISPKTLSKQKFKSGGSEATPDLVAMEGERFIYTSELYKDEELDDQRIKQLTGDRDMSVRGLFSQPHLMNRTGTVFIVTNYRPVIKETVQAIWNRLVFIPFTNYVPDSEANVHLYDELINEQDGIMNWIREGTADYSKNGLMIPDTIMANGKQYRKEQDVIGEFVDDGLKFDDTHDSFTSSSDIKKEFDKWCSLNDKKVKNFSKEFKKRYGTKYYDTVNNIRGYYLEIN